MRPLESPEQIVDVVVALLPESQIRKILGRKAQAHVEVVPDPHVGDGSTEGL